jgi:hypothetical protein
MNGILKDCLGVQEDESVLVITDDLNIVNIFCKEASEMNISIEIFFICKRIRPIKKLSSLLRNAIYSADVVLTPFKERLDEESEFRREIITAVDRSLGGRLAHMPGIDVAAFKECIMKANYEEIERFGKFLAPFLLKGKEAVIESENGTILKIDLGGWSNLTDVDVGKILVPGTWDNLPGGEVCIVPELKGTEGKAVIDGGIPGSLFEDGESIFLEFNEGIASVIPENKTSKKFAEYLKKLDELALKNEKGNIYKIGEFGIGLNRAARKTPNILEFEKKLGTIHIALGDNTHLKGDIEAKEHIDMVIMNPTVTVDGVVAIHKGKLKLEAMKSSLKQNFRNYDSSKIFDQVEYRKTTAPAKIKIYDNRLFVRWIGAGGRIHSTEIGDEVTSEYAALIWQFLVEKNHANPKQIHDHLVETEYARDLSIEDVKKLISLMIDFQILEVYN